MTEMTFVIEPFFSVMRCWPGLTARWMMGEGPSERPWSITSSQNGLQTMVRKPGSAGAVEALVPAGPGPPAGWGAGPAATGGAAGPGLATGGEGAATGAAGTAATAEGAGNATEADGTAASAEGAGGRTAVVGTAGGVTAMGG